MQEGRRSGACCPADHRYFSSVLALGALFGLMMSPCSRLPMVSAFIVVGVPLLTFLVAAPSRIGWFNELKLALRDEAASLLALACRVTGRRQAAQAVTAMHQEYVESVYAPLGDVVADDPLRLHHARRLAIFATIAAVVAGVGLPFVAAETYTFGNFPEAPFVFLTDLVVIGAVSRVVAERMAVRLLEASAALQGGTAWTARLRTAPLTMMLGAALGAVAGLVVVSAAAAASGVESMAVFGADFGRASVWFLRQTAPMALPLGIGVGAIMGAGIGLAQRDR